ncbi:hypothetical protein HDU98_005978 [Podochytrium sp. JEL0797]|nr:hypothetical protein HDU98_005978 [Podochytrium sp. JEL0797]
MPTVNVDKEILFQGLGRSFTLEEFEELCFDYGIELEEETSEREMATKEIGADKAKELSNRLIYRIDIPANRYDMLCAEGIIRALSVFLEKQQPPLYRTVAAPAGKHQKLTVKPETASIRKFVVAAVLRDITFTQDCYNSFIDLQDKLHANVCRRRTLVAIGTHDLDTIEGPFTYEALAPKDIQFTPLNQTQSMNAEELMTFYEADRKLNKFLPIIRDSPVYPVIYDSKRRVLSLPPIINSDHSKIKLSTKNVFIECTATDLTKAKVVLNTVVTMFSEHCKEKFTVEPVEVIQTDGTSTMYPDLSMRKIETDSEYINKLIGTDLARETMLSLLTRMGVTASKGAASEKAISVLIPPTRSDILHPVDIMEDVAIAYGFNNIAKTVPKASTAGAMFPLNKLSDKVRRELAQAGYTEVLPLILCSHDENFKFINKKDDNTTAVKLSNPATIEYQVVRTSLLPGLMKTLYSNKKLPLPLKIFEVSDIVLKDDAVERRAKNVRHMAVVYANTKGSGFELIHGILDRIMLMLNIPMDVGSGRGYCIKECDNATFFPGRRADVFYNGNKIGYLGIVHPEVCQNFEVPFATSALEITIEPFL